MLHIPERHCYQRHVAQRRRYRATEIPRRIESGNRVGARSNVDHGRTKWKVDYLAMSERRDGMALPRLSDFYANLFSRSWLLFLLSEIIVIAIVVTVFGFIVGRVNPESAFMITIIALILIQSFVSYMLLRYTLKPT